VKQFVPGDYQVHLRCAVALNMLCAKLFCESCLRQHCLSTVCYSFFCLQAAKLVAIGSSWTDLCLTVLYHQIYLKLSLCIQSRFDGSACLVQLFWRLPLDVFAPGLNIIAYPC